MRLVLQKLTWRSNSIWSRVQSFQIQKAVSNQVIGAKLPTVVTCNAKFMVLVPGGFCILMPDVKCEGPIFYQT